MKHKFNVKNYLDKYSISDLQTDYTRITDDVNVNYRGCIEDYEDIADYISAEKIIKGVRLA